MDSLFNKDMKHYANLDAPNILGNEFLKPKS